MTLPRTFPDRSLITKATARYPIAINSNSLGSHPATSVLKAAITMVAAPIRPRVQVKPVKDNLKANDQIKDLGEAIAAMEDTMSKTVVEVDKVVNGRMGMKVKEVAVGKLRLLNSPQSAILKCLRLVHITLSLPSFPIDSKARGGYETSFLLHIGPGFSTGYTMLLWVAIFSYSVRGFLVCII